MDIKKFTFIVGLLFVGVGILGFVPGITTPPHPMDPNLAIESAHGRLFGIFPVNLVHNLVHLLLGVWALFASKNFTSSRTYCRSAAIIYAVLAVAGIIPGLNTLFGLAPIHSHDIWLHVILALPLGYYGFVKSSVSGGYHSGHTARV